MPLQSRELTLNKYLPTKQRDQLKQFFQPYSVYRFRARVVDNPELSSCFDALLIGKVEPFATDNELNEAVKKAQLPVVVKDAALGKLTLNRRLNSYEANSKWLGKKIRLSLSDDEGLFQKNLAVAQGLWHKQAAWDNQARVYAAKKMLKLKNEDWSDDDEKPLTAAAFQKKMKLTGINIYSPKSIEFYFNDGDMFWGHSIIVTSDFKKGPRQTQLFG